jgi:large subunit ribosomal protein L33
MAKKEKRVLIAMVCTVCKRQNYITDKNKVEQKEKVKLNKYCKQCKKHTEHKETEKLD